MVRKGAFLWLLSDDVCPRLWLLSDDASLLSDDVCLFLAAAT